MYIVSAAHISIQEPFTSSWIDRPIGHEPLSYNRAIDPDFKEWISPMAARRMSPIILRAIATSIIALKQASLRSVDAIIVGTGLGCIENSEKFLRAMAEQGEQFLQPTHFIQSTHNTIASQIAMIIGCNGYNNTYVDRGISFENALLDAFIQFKLHNIETALVGGHDEMTPDYFKILSKIGFWADGSFAGEGGVSFVLSAKSNERAIAKITAVDCSCRSSTVVDRARKICENIDVDALMLGRSGDHSNDEPYDRFAEEFAPNAQLFTFKDISANYPTASAFGLYAAATMLQEKGLRNTLFYNHYQNEDHALILIEKC